VGFKTDDLGTAVPGSVIGARAA